MAEKKKIVKRKPTVSKSEKRNSAASKSNKKSVTNSNVLMTSNSKARKGRSDAIEKSVQIAQSAGREIQPPAHVRFRKKDYYFWDEIIEKYARADWDNEALTMAAMLARTMADWEKEQYMMRREGSIVKTYKIITDPETQKQEKVLTGTSVNIRQKLVSDYNKNVLAMRRSLSLHARGTEGEARDAGPRRAAAKDLENNILSDDDDDLLARPNLH